LTTVLTLYRRLENTLRGDEPCRTTDPDRWFPEKSNQGRDAAKECYGCRALRPCREWALSVSEVGVWGGMTESQRRDYLRQAGRVTVSLDTREYRPRRNEMMTQ
jgi:hypothetical protein